MSNLKECQLAITEPTVFLESFQEDLKTCNFYPQLPQKFWNAPLKKKLKMNLKRVKWASGSQPSFYENFYKMR